MTNLRHMLEWAGAGVGHSFHMKPEVIFVCLENNLRLLPLVILFAALLAGLTIAFASTPAALFPYALAVALAMLLTTGVLIAVCAFRRESEETCSSVCAAVHCLAPVVMVTALLAIGLALIVIAGFSVTPTVNLVLGVVYALIFSTMSVYFVDMFLEML